MNELSNTKEIIFDKSIELIAESGYESVSMRDIAREVGIKASSIYNHYTGKEKILERIYEYYEDHLNEGRPSDEQMRETMKNGTIEDIMDMFTATSFPKRGGKKAKRMMLITKIIYSRAYSDQRAGEIFLAQKQAAVAFIKGALDYAVELGRMEPFDTYGYAYAFTAQYVVMGIKAFIQPGYEPVKLSEEENIDSWMRAYLPLKK